MSTRLAARVLCLSAVLMLLSACAGEEVDKCFTDRSCGVGYRCDTPKPGDPGMCVECDGAEVTYDGVDNDCDPTTKDGDLDGDGDNWKDAPVGPGNDCDDQNPQVSSLMKEACGDMLDNDCDGQVDEPDCGDVKPPTVSFFSPTDGTSLEGVIAIAVEATDDVGVVQVEVFANGAGTPQGGMSLGVQTQPGTSGRYEFSLDTTTLVDGPLTLSAEATDIADKKGTAAIAIRVDNVSPPLITPIRPMADLAYGGTMTVSANAQDASGVKKLEILVDGVSQKVLTMTSSSSLAMIDYVINTSTMAEGSHQVRFEATDGRDNTGGIDVPFQVDNTAPTVTITSPANGTEVMDMIDIVVDASDNRTVASLSVLGSTITPNLMSVNHTFTLDTTNLPNGVLAVAAVARDGTIVDDLDRGGNEAAATVTLTVNHPQNEPRVVVDPPDGSAITGKYPIAVDASSPFGAQIQEITISVDGVPHAQWTNSIRPIPGHVSRVFDFAEVAPGPHQIEVNVRDGNARSTRVLSDVDVTQAPVFRMPRQFRELDLSLLPNGLPALAVGDVTGDGIADVVGSDANGDSDLFLFEGRIGPRGWSLGRSRDLATYATEVRVADLDGDGTSEIVFLTSSEIGTMDLTTTPPRIVASPLVLPLPGVFSYRNQPADIDGDGFLDLLLQHGTEFKIYMNDGTGAFTYGGSHTDTNAQSYAEFRLGDVDGDGDLDVVGCYTSITTFINDNGVFSTALQSAGSLPFRSDDCAVQDVTGDGVVDVVLRSGQGGVVTMEGSTAMPGAFTELATSAFDFADIGNRFQLMNVDADTLPDIVFINGNIALNQGGGVFALAQPNRFFFSTDSLRVIDLDGDGDEDLIAAGGGTRKDTLYVLNNQGNGTFDGFQVIPAGFNATTPGRWVVTGDFWGDAGLDVAVYSSGTVPGEDNLEIFENIGADFALHTTSIGNNFVGIAAGNIDGQGYDDLVLAGNNPVTDLTVLLNQGLGTFDVHSSTVPADLVKLGDPNNDQVMDIVYARGGSPGATGLIDFDPTTNTFIPIDEVPLSNGALALEIADLGNEPAMNTDYAVCGDSSVTVRQWTGSSFTTVSFPSLLETEAHACKVTYFGSDPIPDLLIGGRDALGYGLFVMNGVQGFGLSSPTRTLSDRAFHLQPGDFNQDGLSDLFVASVDQKYLLVGSPTGFFPATYAQSSSHESEFPTNFGWFTPVVVGDFNNDGRPDLAKESGRDLIIMYNETP